MTRVEVLKKRIETLEILKEDQKKLIAFNTHYTINPVDFINDLIITYDPRAKPAYLPFILFPKQEEFINWLHERFENKEDGLAEKSRDMGFTWLACSFSIWMWLFHGGVKVGWGSRKEALVDRVGDPDSIFEKMRMILRYLPDIFLPDNFNESKDATFMKILNRVNGSSITGEAGDNIGRGGRSSIYFKDESAFYERPLKIEAALSQNSDVKIDISTPNGNGNPFYEKRMSGKLPVFTMHWKDDPRKNEEWYKQQCYKLDPVTVAQEIDINYDASVENICIPKEWIMAAVNLELDNDGLIVIGYDVADEGADFNAEVAREGQKVTHIAKWKEGNTAESSRRVFNTAVEIKADKIYYDSIGVGAGAKAEFSEIKKKTKEGGNIKITGVSTGESAAYFKDEKFKDTDRFCKDMFLNLRARLWWTARMRFKATYDYVNGEDSIDKEDLLSIPNHNELINELSRPKYQFNENGKIQIESKKAMKKRGIPSPNIADAFILTLYNGKKANSGLSWDQFK